MVFSAALNNFQLYQSVLLVEKNGVLGENHGPTASHWRTLALNVVSSTPRLRRIQLTTLMVIGTDGTGSCKLPYDDDHDGPLL